MRFFVFSYVHIFARMNLRLLLYPLRQQLLDEIGEILTRVDVFQQPCRCFLGLFAYEHSRWLILRVTAFAEWSSSLLTASPSRL